VLQVDRPVRNIAAIAVETIDEMRLAGGQPSQEAHAMSSTRLLPVGGATLSRATAAELPR
jgi:hypothetical protein